MQKTKRILGAGMLILLCLLTACGGAAQEEIPASFTIDFLDTGKSDCVLVRMDGLVIVSDTADWDDFSQIDSQLKKYGVTRIDYMILSHYDKDHIGSAARLVEEYPVGLILGPDYTETSEAYAALEAAAAEAGVEWLRLTENYLLETDSGAILLDPPDTDYGDDNNNSLITTIRYGQDSFLFMGDAKKDRSEEFLAVAGEHYTLIKLPHHGNSNRYLEELVRLTRPAYAVELLSPEESVEPDLLEALEEAGTRLFLSREGTVRLWWSEEGLQIRQEQ